MDEYDAFSSPLDSYDHFSSPINPATVSEEDSYREMFARDPVAAGEARLFGARPTVATPEENGRAALGMLPVTGNVIAAQDAYDAFGDLRKASKSGDIHEQRKAMTQVLMGFLGALSPLPWGRSAGMAAKEAKDTAYAIPAWHGSPHDFDEFKLDKIGTGEGAQAYGHGLYFAENPEVAKGYKEALSNRGYSINGEPVHDEITAHWADVGRRGGDLAPHLQRYKEDAEYWRQMAGGGKDANALERHMAAQDNAAAIERVMNGDVQSVTPGRLYHTEIDAEPHQLLDWDKPLSEQHPEVQKALQAIPHEPRPQYDFSGNPIPVDSRTGEGYYNSLAETLGTPYDPLSRKTEWMNHEGASKALREAGIPGIRYLDQGSRGQGGTSNYVIFDQGLVKILSKE